MLSSEAIKPEKLSKDKTQNVAHDEENIRDIMQTLSLSIAVPSESKNNHFATQLCYYLTRMSEQLGIFAENHISSEIIDEMQLTLRGIQVESIATIPLKDAEGNYFSEITLQASSGIMSIHGRNRDTYEGLGIDYVTVMTAVNALTGLLAQCYQQLTQAIPAKAVVNSVLSPMGVSLLSASQYIADASAQEPFPLPEGFDDITCQPPFCSADGFYFELESLEAKPWKTFWESLNIDGVTAGKGWKAFQLRYAKAVSPLPSVMVDMLRQYTLADIKKKCVLSGVYITQVYTLNDYAKTSQCQQLWRQGPWQFSGWQQGSPNEVLPHRVKKNQTNNNKLPLSSIKIVESCRRIQGPLATHILSLLGAEVIRIEPPGGDPLRGMPPVVDGCSVRFNAINGNKKIVEINIKENVGKQEVSELIDNADVFIHNWAPHKAAQLGLDYKALSALNPQLIYSYASGWANTSAPEDAHYLHLPGTDFMVQAVSGVASTIAIKQQSSEANGGSLFTVLDTLGGAIAAQGIVIALLARQLQSRRCYLETSLLGAATVLSDQALSAIYHVCYQSYGDHYNGVFKTKTQMIAVSLPPLDSHAELARLLGIDISPEFAPRDTAERAALLANQFQLRSAESWLSQLSALKISVALVNADLAALSERPALQAWIEKTHVDYIKSPWRFL